MRISFEKYLAIKNAKIIIKHLTRCRSKEYLTAEIAEYAEII